MQILPVDTEAFDRWGCRVPQGYAPSACLAWLRDDAGMRPAIYSFAASAWLTAERDGEAYELPSQDQEQLTRLLAPNLGAVSAWRA